MQCWYFFYWQCVWQHSHLGTGHGPVLVPPPVQLLQWVLHRQGLCADRLVQRSHTHHQDLLTVWRLTHHEGIILQVRQHWHLCNAAAASPPPPRPQQGSSQQHGAHCQGDGGDERWRRWPAADSGGL